MSSREECDDEPENDDENSESDDNDTNLDDSDKSSDEEPEDTTANSRGQRQRGRKRQNSSYGR